MIEHLELKNFRSIIHDSIEFGQITVLIGANGSGKSNLIKALEFLSGIAYSGIAVAVGSQGGANGLVPKVYSEVEIPTTPVFVKYRCRMAVPRNYPEEYAPRVVVDHLIRFVFPPGKVLSLEEEELTLHQVLSTAACMFNNKSTFDKIPTSDPAHPTRNSTLTLRRVGSGEPTLVEHPTVDKRNSEAFFRAVGFPMLPFAKKTTFGEQVKSIWERVWTHNNEKRAADNKQHSFLDPDANTLLDFSRQFLSFQEGMQDIRRYDLLVNELRREQPPTDEIQLTEHGDNMPATLREISDDDERKGAWRRLQRTFGIIAPHITSMHPEPLRNGNEFIEFVESKTGRGVESWSSSDGSLRALAILLAIESAAEGETILIEEPEQNLHPWAVRSLMEHIRETVQDRKLQVVITTHSQQVLERIHPDELRIATRTVEDGTKFKTIKDLIPHGDVKMGEIGELWVKGLLSGVPTYGDRGP